MQKGAATLYHQLANTLRERIASGIYLPGDAIPTEPQLCEEFKMSRITVRQAVAILENAGMVQRQQGRGTFVRELSRQSLGWNYGHVEELIFLAKQTRLELYDKEKINASETIATDLEVMTGQPVYAIKGIRHIQERYRASYRAYVPEPIGRSLKLETTDKQVLFLEVEKIACERIKTANQYVYATTATEALAGEMLLKVGDPLLVTKRIYHSAAGRPLIAAFTHFPGEVYQSFSVLERQELEP